MKNLFRDILKAYRGNIESKYFSLLENELQSWDSLTPPRMRETVKNLFDYIEQQGAGEKIQAEKQDAPPDDTTENIKEILSRIPESKTEKMIDDVIKLSEKNCLTLDGDYIVITTDDPYGFINGLFRYWETVEYIPEKKGRAQGKNTRIKKSFTWRDNNTGESKDFHAGTLDNSRKEIDRHTNRIKNLIQ
jgi:hypothetical protein